MPSMLRVNSPDRRRRRDNEKDDTKQDRKEKHRSSSHRKTSAKDKSTSRTSIETAEPKKRNSMPAAISEEDAPSLKSESKSSLPYPSFSKLHSKEAVGRPELNVFTPPATDVNASKEKLSATRQYPGANAPPSPPLTESNTGRSRANVGKPVSVETIAEEDTREERGSKQKIRLQSKSSRGISHSRSSSDLAARPSPSKAREQTSSPLKPRNINQIPQRSVSQPIKPNDPVLERVISEDAASSSDGTSIAPEQPSVQRPGSRIPRGPVISDIQSNITQIDSRGPTPLEALGYDPPTPSWTPASQAPPPPPPPPTVSVPRVDYLLQNGGLHHSVPRNLLLAGKPMAVQQAAKAGQVPVIVANLFEPYHQLLDDYNRIIDKSGSMAVATGYRSVARRLLDRLEAVFARDISNEFCACCMCSENDRDDPSAVGVSWGEILELVAGRQDLPSWPPFSFVMSTAGLGIFLEPHTPMQKLDIDVPEEYREHYIRQSRKTKQSVDKWLNRQNDTSTSPPEEVDDETLTFAILTHLSVEQRANFKNLLHIVDRPIEPPRRAPSPDKNLAAPTPTPQPRDRVEEVVTAGLAIQRLYRLASPPRDPEAAMFLLNYPGMHNALATLAAVSNDEWDILISGRFDGFLRSGAEEDFPAPEPRGKAAGRNTPHSNAPSRGPSTNGYGDHLRHSSNSMAAQQTPNATVGAPISLDEDTEIAVLSEIERDIYTSMESLEDAFETLHLKAETIRRVLRERSAGLAAAAQRRKSSGIEVRLGTPASGIHGFGINGSADNGRWETGTDDGIDWDGASELAPDDSASNISTSKRRRPKRRNERRTPMIEEDDEEDDTETSRTPSPVKRP